VIINCGALLTGAALTLRSTDGALLTASPGAGSLGWTFPMLKYKYILEQKIYGSNFIEQHSENCYGLIVPKC